MIAKALLVAAFAATALTAPALAQTSSVPPGTPAKVVPLLPQMEMGTWTLDEPGCFGPFWGCYTSQETYIEGEQPRIPFPMKPELAARFKEIQDALGRGESIFDPDAQCHPSGMPSRLRGNFKWAFMPDRMIHLMGGAEYRMIHMDGRAIPDQDPVEYTYNGYSVGKWDGDTLVVETRNIRGPDTQISPHIPKSDNFWIIERYTPLNADRMAYEIQMKDEDNWTGVFTEKYHLKRNPTGDLGPQTPCIPGDGQRYAVDPATGVLNMTGPGGEPLEIAEP
jgi:hypothetical protein